MSHIRRRRSAPQRHVLIDHGLLLSAYSMRRRSCHLQATRDDLCPRSSLQQQASVLSDRLGELGYLSTCTSRQSHRRYRFALSQPILREQTILISIEPESEITICKEATWNSAVMVAGTGIPGIGLNEVDFPQDVFVEEDQTLYIADTSNHRIIKK